MIYSAARIFAVACELLGQEPLQVASGSRLAGLVHARMMIIGAARTMTYASYPEIARVLNKASHHTILHLHKKYRREVGSKEHLQWIEKMSAACERRNGAIR